MYFGVEQYEVLNVNHIKGVHPENRVIGFVLLAIRPAELGKTTNTTFTTSNNLHASRVLQSCCNPWSAWASKRRCVRALLLVVKVVQVVFHVSTSNHSIFEKNHKKPFPFPIFVINDTFREWILSFPVKKRTFAFPKVDTNVTFREWP